MQLACLTANYKKLVRLVMDSNLHFLHLCSSQPPKLGDEAVLFRIETVSVREDGAAVVEGRGMERVRIQDVWLENGESAEENLFFAKIHDNVRIK